MGSNKTAFPNLEVRLVVDNWETRPIESKGHSLSSSSLYSSLQLNCFLCFKEQPPPKPFCKHCSNQMQYMSIASVSISSVSSCKAEKSNLGVECKCRQGRSCCLTGVTQKAHQGARGVRGSTVTRS